MSGFPFPHSVRARLALWFASAFALLLFVFAVAAYVFLSRTSLARVDEYLTETVLTVADAVRAGHGAGAGLGAVLTEFRPRDVTIVALDRATGKVVSAAHTPGPRRVPAPVPEEELAALLRGAAREHGARLTVTAPAGKARIVVLPTTAGGREVVIAAAQSLAARDRMMHEAEAALAIGLPLMLICATAGGYWLARRSLSPVTAMAARADRMGATTLHERLPLGNPRDELGRLAAVFNRLLARLDDAFDRQRRFAADASHELRTPVTTIGGEAELALSRPDRPASELREALRVIRGETRRLATVVDDLFLLARADAGDRQIAREALYVSDLATESVRALRSVALAKGVTIRCEVAGDLPFRGDEALLRRLLANLLDNAVKHTPPRGSCTLTAERRNGAIVLSVVDSGPGVPEEARAHLFDRFFRVSRTSAGPGDSSGAGLGLAIARWIAEAHGGSLTLAESGPDGSRFVATLADAADSNDR